MINAMKQALEDISKSYDVLAFTGKAERVLGILEKTQKSLRAAIEQAERQEPVAVVASVVEPGDKGVRIKWFGGFPQIGDRLYTAPPPPQRQPLTDEEATKLWRESVHKAAFPPNRDALLLYKEAIERKHGIGGVE